MRAQVNHHVQLLGKLDIGPSITKISFEDDCELRVLNEMECSPHFVQRSSDVQE